MDRLQHGATLRRMKTPTVLLAAALLAACAAPATTVPVTPPAAANDPVHATGQRAMQAATAPLNDLNLVQAEIPPVLQAALRGPYAAPADPGCAALTAEIQALDAFLGADLDTVATPSNPSLIERGAGVVTGAVSDAAVGVVRGVTDGVVPFRRWVRKLSGAERYSRDVAAAIAAGTIRRAFLKGLRHAAACAPATALPAAAQGPAGTRSNAIQQTVN
jgi:hypothetical protein